MTLDSKERMPPIILKMSAFKGIPFDVNFASFLGNVRSSERDHSMRDEAYSPEFAADKIAVRMTKFMKSAA